MLILPYSICKYRKVYINCVYDLDDFERQMPDNAKVLVRDSITDDRGTRFILIGKLYEKNNL